MAGSHRFKHVISRWSIFVLPPERFPSRHFLNNNNNDNTSRLLRTNENIKGKRNTDTVQIHQASAPIPDTHCPSSGTSNITIATVFLPSPTVPNVFEPDRPTPKMLSAPMADFKTLSILPRDTAETEQVSCLCLVTARCILCPCGSSRLSYLLSFADSPPCI
jgi:hypothetical protein